MSAAFDEVLEGGRGEDGALVFESGEPARQAVFSRSRATSTRACSRP